MPRKKKEDTVSHLDDLSGFDTTTGTELSSLTLSHSLSLSEAHSKTEKRERVNKQELVSKQLAHDFQLLKIEVSQKNLLIDQIKSEHAEKVEELEEKLSDALHHGQIVQARLDTQLHLQQAEARKQHADTQQELQGILTKQKKLEEANALLLQRTARVKEELQSDLTLSHEKYMHMKALHEDQLSIADFVAIRLYESTEPLKSEVAQQKQHIRHHQGEVHQLQNELEQWREKYSQAESSIQSLNVKCHQLSLALTDTKSEIQHDNYKINNYDAVKSERDQLSGDCTDLKQAAGYLEAANQALTQERDDLKKQLSALQQTLVLTNKDKDYLSKQMVEKNHKYKYAEEQRHVLVDQLEKMKQQREDMYEKYVSVRDQYKTEYERRLQEEIDHLRKQTDAEVGRLRSGTKEMYEQEIRSLREARDMALMERERIQTSERELRDRCDTLQAEYQTLQSDLNTKISDIHNQLRLKTFELERSQLLYEETLKNFKASQLDKEKIQKKLEVVTQDVMTLESSSTQRVQELENECSHLRQQLTAYQQIEQHLDDVMLQAAEIGDDIEAERVISAYESQFPVQTTAKRHLQQSVRLAQRVLSLQKKNTTLQDDLEKETKKRNQLEGMLEESSSLLQSLQQPQTYLIEVMRNKDGKIQELTKDSNQLKEEIKQLHKERKDLLTSKQQLAADLEKLLGHGEELRGMKETLRSTLTARTAYR
ncbi:progesterone-induced-blocking factor 1 isoform X1 [Lingula anatina]|uniref:Progesterone-induced-blocking factor 1 isoform X1 n=1 Tax=Lingula anatina TaxID=7574 RepID=A0A1S3KCL8_LINAN|nr:progesterone-induced-blocking factor 1 isoform X1 [Lingula anatina]|eukprot:XP_013420378.1 progesterone-induced-blocking factor 1 isoform X1 [Lingula anatina]